MPDLHCSSSRNFETWSLLTGQRNSLTLSIRYGKTWVQKSFRSLRNPWKRYIRGSTHSENLLCGYVDHSQIVKLHLENTTFYSFCLYKIPSSGYVLIKRVSEFFLFCCSFLDELFKPDTLHADFGTWMLIENQLSKFRSLPLGHDHQVIIANLLTLTLWVTLTFCRG